MEMLALARALVRKWTRSYYIWSTAFFLLCIAVVVIPVVIASGWVQEKETVQALSGVAAIFAALANWSNLGNVAKNFDEARQDLMLAAAEFTTPEKMPDLRKAIEAAQKKVMQWAPVLPHARAAAG